MYCKAQPVPKTKYPRRDSSMTWNLLSSAWLLIFKRFRAASMPCALLNPFAPFSVWQHVVYVPYMRFSQALNKFSIWLLANRVSRVESQVVRPGCCQFTARLLAFCSLNKFWLWPKVRVAKPDQNHQVMPNSHTSNYRLNVSNSKQYLRLLATSLATL